MRVDGWPDALDGNTEIQLVRIATTAAGGGAAESCLESAENTARQGMPNLSKQIQQFQTQCPDLKGVWISPGRPPLDQAYRRRVFLHAAATRRAVLPLGPDAEGCADHPAGGITYNRCPVLDITSGGY